MYLEICAIGAGMVLSYFLKDVQFLILDLSFLGTGLVHPDFLLIFIAFFALYRSLMMGLWIGFFGGLLEDGSNWFFDSERGGFTTIIGLHALVYSIMGYGIGRVNVYLRNYQQSFTILLILITVIFVRFTIWFLHGSIDSFNKNYTIVGPALYTTLISMIFFPILSWAYKIPRGTL